MPSFNGSTPIVSEIAVMLQFDVKERKRDLDLLFSIDDSQG